MKVYVVTTTCNGKVLDVEVFWKREQAASMMMRKAKSLNEKSENPAKTCVTSERATGGIYQVKYGDVVSEIFVREI